MANSENGWPLVVEAQLEPLAWLPNNARLLAGPVAQVLGYVARRFAARVEPITSTSTYRPNAIIAGTKAFSNHASGTALDLNGGKHAMGESGTFAKIQVDAIRQILAECSGVLRWGGDYVSRPDEMHFEIRPGATAAQVAAAAAVLNPTNPPSEEDIMASIDDLKALLNTELASVVSQVNAVTTASAKQGNVLILRQKNGQMVLVNGVGAHTLKPGEWLTLNNLGYTIDHDNMDPGPFDALIAAFGGAA
jgi:hypothetical protein